MIDIILPNYNKVKYIESSILSLLSQTYLEWRCIVIDGYSDDGSWEIINKYAENDYRFELYQLERKGLYNSWNFGLLKVTNPIFCILTSDDLWDQNWLSEGLQSLNNYPNAICSASRARIIDENGNKKKIAPHTMMGDSLFKPDEKKQIREGIIDSLAQYFLGPIYTSIHTLLCRKKIIDEGHLFSEDLGSIADYEWAMGIGLFGDIVFHPNIESYWRFYSDQATNPRKQLEIGKQMLEIHKRVKIKLCSELGDFADMFFEIATKYDKKVLTYHYYRPCLENLFEYPFREFINLLKVLGNMPVQFLMDIILKTKKTGYYKHESFKFACYVIEEYTKYVMNNK